MAEPIKILLLLIFLISCNSSVKNKDCKEPPLKPIYYDKGCDGDLCGYYHFLMLESYEAGCFNDYDFIYIADKYLDSVKTNIPVRGITFVKSFSFHPRYDSGDFGPLGENSIVSINYTKETMQNKVPEVSSISIWINGKRKELDYIHLSSRQHRMKYYNETSK